MPELVDFEKQQNEANSDESVSNGTDQNGIDEKESCPGFSDVSDSIKESLKTILTKVVTFEEYYRYRQLRGLKRNNLFWHGFTNIVWNGPNDLSGDWVSVVDAIRNLGNDALKADPSLYDETVAVYRAYGESIVGALSSSPPTVRFNPGDSNVIDDIRTAGAYTRISQKINQDNKAEVLMPSIIKTLCNEGLVGIYNYNQYDHKYGTVERDIYGSANVNVTNSYCPNCNALVNSETEEEKALDLTDGAILTNQEVLQAPLKEEFGDDGQLATGELPPDPSQQMPPKPIQCPECGYSGPAQTEQYQEQQPVKKDTQSLPKCHQILEVYGALQIQISQFADKPQDVGFLILYSEAHYAQMRDLFPWIRNAIVPGEDQGNYYRWSRQFTGVVDENQSQVTNRRCWFRPWMFEILEDEEKRNELKEKFPKGCYVIFVNDEFAQAFDEELDEHWTLTLHPLSDKIYADPLLKFALPIQRMVDDVTNLTLQTIKFGIPLVFADPTYFNFTKFGQTQALPGALYEMKSAPGKSINDNFGSVKTASLSREVDTFADRLSGYGQFVTGAMPAIFGGASEGTLGQSDLNKQGALQRLGITWLVVKTLWATVMSKAVKQYAENLLEDEVLTEKIGNSYINSVIRLEDLTGKIGEVEPESSENFPVTSGQKQQTLMQLFGLNNQGITSMLGLPENAAMVSRIIGLNELFIPGDDQRNKQLDEISQLIQGQETINPQTGQPASSVPIEPQVDNDQIHITTCQDFICSEMGQDLKRFSPGGYANILAHAQEHQMNLQMIQQQQMQAQAQMQQASKPPQDPNQFSGE
jgi:hypothetical protein